MPTLTTTADLLARATAGGRLSLEEGLRLWQDAATEDLRHAADAIRLRRHPDGIVTYLVDRNINYTNVCIIDCGFCAFYRKPASPEGYLLTNEQIGQKVEELQRWGGSRILLQGGVHPYLKLDYYTGLLRYLKEHYPDIAIDGFSPV
ncbi:MAG TPA: radical SAM protein, partial [Ktedonobacterales bacterium]